MSEDIGNISLRLPIEKIAESQSVPAEANERSERARVVFSKVGGAFGNVLSDAGAGSSGFLRKHFRMRGSTFEITWLGLWVP